MEVGFSGLRDFGFRDDFCIGKRIFNVYIDFFL